MENTNVLNPQPVPTSVPVVETQEKKVSATNDKMRVEIIKAREVNTTLFTQTWILLASGVLMIATCLLIAYLHVYKVFRKFKIPDPFHDSRKHPLNDPHAARG